MSEAQFITWISAARKLGVPAAWLRRELEAGRLPHIRAGNRLLVDPQAIAAALTRQPKRATTGGAQ